MTGSWRSLAEQAGDPAFAERVAQEFPALAPLLVEGTSRRRILQIMAASALLAGCGLGDPRARSSRRR